MTRLDQILRVGLLRGEAISGYVNGRKTVEFKEDTVKGSQKNCINVPWDMTVGVGSERKRIFGPHPHRIVEYIKGVINRIYEEKGKKVEVRPVDNVEVQAYAKEEAKKLNLKPARRYVIEFFDLGETARYCMVPLNRYSTTERVERAISHLKRYVTKEAMPKDHGYEAWKDTCLREFYTYLDDRNSKSRRLNDPHQKQKLSFNLDELLGKMDDTYKSTH